MELIKIPLKKHAGLKALILQYNHLLSEAAMKILVEAVIENQSLSSLVIDDYTILIDAIKSLLYDINNALNPSHLDLNKLSTMINQAENLVNLLPNTPPLKDDIKDLSNKIKFLTGILYCRIADQNNLGNLANAWQHLYPLCAHSIRAVFELVSALMVIKELPRQKNKKDIYHLMLLAFAELTDLNHDKDLKKFLLQILHSIIQDTKTSYSANLAIRDFIDCDEIITYKKLLDIANKLIISLQENQSNVFVDKANSLQTLINEAAASLTIEVCNKLLHNCEIAAALRQEFGTDKIRLLESFLLLSNLEDKDNNNYSPSFQEIKQSLLIHIEEIMINERRNLIADVRNSAA